MATAEQPSEIKISFQPHYDKSMPSETNDASEHRRLIHELRSLTEDISTASLPASVIPLLELDLTAQQVKVLTILVTTLEGGTVQSLSRLFNVSMASMSGMLDRLVTHGVAERTVDPKDQRIRRIKATSLGREVIGELVANRPELADEILYRISADELRSLTIGLAAIARELRAQQQPR